MAALPVHPPLFAGYAVLFLYAQNIHLVRASEVVEPLGYAVAGALLLFAGLAAVTRSLARGALAASGAVIWFFGHGHFGALAGDELAGVPTFALWLVGVALLTTLLVYLQPRLGQLTVGLNVVGLVLVTLALTTIVPDLLQRPLRAADGDLGPTGLTATRSTDRDIYYLVFDRYGSDNALAKGFGVTDNDLPDWLRERGFYVAPGAYANYIRTTPSLASVLHLDYLDDLVESQGRHSSDYRPVYEMFNQHLVGRFLREQGYRYHHIGSWWEPTRSVRIADENSSVLTTTEFHVVLHGTTALPALLEALPRDSGEEEMPVGDRTHVTHARFQFREIPRVIGAPSPKFVMAHVLLPHDPYTFDEDGGYVSREARADVPIEQQFRAQLAYTNREIKRIVELLLARPEAERPIIVIQADEGPYPHRYHFDQDGFDWSRATDDELETKFGILNAFYLPPEPDVPADAPAPYPTITSVNTFRLVLGRYFGLDLPFLPDRVWTSPSESRFYDLTEVTHRLDWPTD